MKINIPKTIHEYLLMIAISGMAAAALSSGVAYAAASVNSSTTKPSSTVQDASGAPKPSFKIVSVKVSGITANSATVSWQTNTNSKSTIQYGSAQNTLINTRTTSGSATNHTVEITNLPSGQKIFYTIIAASKDSLQQNQNGNFTTLKASKLSAFAVVSGGIIGTLIFLAGSLFVHKKRRNNSVRKIKNTDSGNATPTNPDSISPPSADTSLTPSTSDDSRVDFTVPTPAKPQSLGHQGVLTVVSDSSVREGQTSPEARGRAPLSPLQSLVRPQQPLTVRTQVLQQPTPRFPQESWRQPQALTPSPLPVVIPLIVDTVTAENGLDTLERGTNA